jgi:hypothetical protein
MNNRNKKRKLDQNTIPDISYHLSFCFLTLKELTLIAQCCKEWNRIVTEPSFLSMFRHEGVVRIIQDDDKFCDACASPFRHLVRHIRLYIHSMCLTHLIQFPKLVSLNFKIDHFYHIDFIHLFQELGPRLHTLKVTLSSVPIDSTKIQHFQTGLSYLTSLTSLTLKSGILWKQTIQSVSFLPHLKHLRSFSCDCMDSKITYRDLVDNLANLTELTHLMVQDRYLIKYICEELQNSKLIHLGRIQNIHFDHNLFLKHVNMNHLKTIDVVICWEHTIPIGSIAKMIQHLEIKYRKFTDQDVNAIISLPNLKSLTLYGCMFGHSQLKNLFEGLSSQLENLKIILMKCQIPFQTLSECLKLKTLTLRGINGLEASQFELLSKFIQLETIKVKYCDNINKKTLSSTTFPQSLKQLIVY